MTLKDRQWECEECHTFHQSRDQNAALNILYFSEGKIPQEVRESTPKEEDAISEVSSEIKAVRNI